ncbi:MAG: ATP-dependent helicase, partial [Flavobacteriales bacterium]
KTTLEKLVIASNAHDQSIWDVINFPNQFPSGLNQSTQAKLNKFATMIKSFQAELHSKNAYDLAEHIARESGLVRELTTDKSPEGVARYENIQELLNGIKLFTENSEVAPDEIVTLPDFMVDVALLTDADNNDEDDNKVSLMTIHAAKGLEFPYVFIVGLEENLFPSQLSLNSRTELEEERRLFYVALTRAKKKATLSYALSRYRWGQLTHCEPSRFLEDIDEKHVNLPKQSPSQSNPFSKPGTFDSQRQRFTKSNSSGTTFNPKPSSPPSANFKKVDPRNAQAAPVNQADISVGTEVEHARFGKGKVLKIEGDSPNSKATVFFPSAGQKQLLLKFAKLKVL